MLAPTMVASRNGSGRSIEMKWTLLRLFLSALGRDLLAFEHTLE